MLFQRLLNRQISTLKGFMNCIERLLELKCILVCALITLPARVKSLFGTIQLYGIGLNVLCNTNKGK